MSPENPYQSPENSFSVATRAGASLSSRVWWALPWIAVAGLGLCSFYLVYRNHLLRDQYPNLEDHAPGVDWYWPHVVHLMNKVIAIALATTATILAGITVVLRTTRKSARESAQNRDGGKVDCASAGAD
jgi:heme/copper-type cytochrome/quinol oxidase subunit 2